MRLARLPALTLLLCLPLTGCIGDSGEKKAEKPKISKRAASTKPRAESHSLPTLRSSAPKEGSGSGSGSGAQGAGGSSAGSSQGGGGGGPGTYNINLSGTTYQWNGQTGQYEPSENFNRAGVLIVDEGNDFGVLSGSIAETTAGRLWFVTNSYVYRNVSSVASYVWNARVPAASVSASADGRQLEATVGTGARAVQLNSFQVTSRTLSSPKQITAGKVSVDLSGGSPSGSVELYGGGYVEPGNNFPVDLIKATISG
jgi:hypothetical protein